MRTLLINPPWFSRKENIWHDISSVLPPLGLAWLATALERRGHDVHILDAHAERLDFGTLVSRIREMGRFQYVGITATTSLIANALEIARAIRAEFPEIRIILGGVHPTVLPAEVLAEPAVDIVVRGEGEQTIVELVEDKPLDTVSGISFRENGCVVHTPDRPLIKDIDSLGIPAYHLLPMHRYYPATGASKRLPATSMLSTRGCPGKCTFCYRLFGHRLRARSGHIVAEEVKYLQDRYNIREVAFYDDTFTAFKREVFSFCQGVEDLKIDLTWSCFSRVDSVTEELLQVMKDTGLHQIMYGIESSSNEILQNINKRFNTEQVENVIQMTKRIGIDVRAAFMLGNPGETEHTMKDTLDFAKRLNPEIAVFNITTPYPGTEMFNWADENGYLLTKDWEQYDLTHPVMELPTVSAVKVKEFYDQVYRKFYLRPEYISMRLRKIRSITDLNEVFQGMQAVIGV
ncbi:MAG: radical SAM protein [Anaerolineales bacterium]|nr:radical SAM protein [Anaerolineales bacterium]